MTEPEEIMQLHEAMLESSFIPFPESGIVNVSDEQAVYIIYDKNNNVLHVGTTKGGFRGLNRRLYDHLARTSTFRKNFVVPNKLALRKGCKFKYITVTNARTRALLESLTAGLLCPTYFGTGEKKS